MSLCLKLVVFLCLSFAVVASFVSLSTNFWIEHDSSAHHQGLWFFCNDEDIGCQEFDEDPQIKSTGMPDWHNGVLMLLIIGAAIQVVSLFLFFISCISNRFLCCNIFLVVLLGIAWICITAAMAIYTQKFHSVMDNGYSWGYSFILGWVSFTFNLLSVILAFVYMMTQQNIRH